MTPDELADKLIDGIGIHCGDFPSGWARDADATIRAAIREAEAAGRSRALAACERLRAIGSRMANLCSNLGQPGWVFEDRHRAEMAELCRQWDEAAALPPPLPPEEGEVVTDSDGPLVQFPLPGGNVIQIRLRRKVTRVVYDTMIRRIYDLAEFALVEGDPPPVPADASDQVAVADTGGGGAG
jgi:hypothetical protein